VAVGGSQLVPFRRGAKYVGVGKLVQYRAKIRVIGRKSTKDLMAWDRLWWWVNKRDSPFQGIMMRWSGAN
jgi:hypothetical protein